MTSKGSKEATAIIVGYLIMMAVYFLLLRPVLQICIRVLTVVGISEFNHFKDLSKSSKIISLYFGVRRVFLDSIKRVVREEDSPDKSIKVDLYRRVSSVFSIYPLVRLMEGEYSVSKSISDIVKALETKGRDILSHLTHVPFLGAFMVISSIVVILTGSNSTLAFFLLIYLLSMYLKELTYILVLSFVEESEESVSFVYDEGMTSSEISSQNVLSVDWYTGSVLYESIHTLFRKEGKKHDPGEEAE